MAGHALSFEGVRTNARCGHCGGPFWTHRWGPRANSAFLYPYCLDESGREFVLDVPDQRTATGQTWREAPAWGVDRTVTIGEAQLVAPETPISAPHCTDDRHRWPKEADAEGDTCHCGAWYRFRDRIERTPTHD
jgi:hypothetical protein